MPRKKWILNFTARRTDSDTRKFQNLNLQSDGSKFSLARTMGEVIPFLMVVIHSQGHMKFCRQAGASQSRVEPVNAKIEARILQVVELLRSQIEPANAKLDDPNNPASGSLLKETLYKSGRTSYTTAQVEPDVTKSGVLRAPVLISSLPLISSDYGFLQRGRSKLWLCYSTATLFIIQLEKSGLRAIAAILPEHDDNGGGSWYKDIPEMDDINTQIALEVAGPRNRRDKQRRWY
ncbi:hypothetical protein C8J57DRAFT_1251345 [Mycena rebaudengoi]|nr:hypothetical protein C8J57DRAFT_1251345 [Mycena rebaudengoi]